MHLLRGLHFVCAYHNINLRASHIIAESITPLLMLLLTLVRQPEDSQPQSHRHCERIFVASHLDWLLDIWRSLLMNSLRTALQQAQELTLQSRQGILTFVARLVYHLCRPRSNSLFCILQTCLRDCASPLLEHVAFTRYSQKPTWQQRPVPSHHTVNIRQEIYHLLDQDPGRYENRLMSAACCLVFVFLRN